MMKVLKMIIDLLVIIMTGKDDECVTEGYCDYSGEGRNEYGR